MAMVFNGSQPSVKRSIGNKQFLRSIKGWGAVFVYGTLPLSANLDVKTDNQSLAKDEYKDYLIGQLNSWGGGGLEKNGMDGEEETRLVSKLGVREENQK